LKVFLFFVAYRKKKLDSYDMINQYSNFGWEICLYLMLDDVSNMTTSNKFINIIKK